MAIIIPFQNFIPKVFCCPECGSTDLSAMVLVDAVQNPDGSWGYQPLSEEDLTYEMNNPNTQVRCSNPTCGVPISPDGTSINLRDGETLLQWWLRENSGSEDFKDVPFDHLSEDLQKEYLEWENEVTYLHWEGVIGDCKVLEP